MPAVSVIIPTYNRARQLPEAISSVCQQTMTDWELIIMGREAGMRYGVHAVIELVNIDDTVESNRRHIADNH